MIINQTFIVAAKELRKYWGSKKIVFATLLLPGLIIFVVYSVLGIFTEKQSKNIVSGKVYVVDMPSSFESLICSAELDTTRITRQDIPYVKQKIEEQEKSVLLVFPENFEEDLVTKNNPNIELYYNSVVSQSKLSYNIVQQLLSKYKDLFSPVFVINEKNDVCDLAKKEDSMGKTIAATLPMLIVTLVFSACMAVSAESYAGEKERKTLIKLLLTPISKKAIVLGKTIALSTLAFISGMSSFLGAIFSLPRLYAFECYNLMQIYEMKYIVLIIIDIFSISILLVTVMSLISAISGTIKEATTTLSPFGGFAMLIGMTSMMQTEPADKWYFFLLPIYNNVQVLYEIMVFDFHFVNYIMMVCGNIIYAFALGYLLAHFLNSEKIIYA